MRQALARGHLRLGGAGAAPRRALAAGPTDELVERLTDLVVAHEEHPADDGRHPPALRVGQGRGTRPDVVAAPVPHRTDAVRVEPAGEVRADVGAGVGEVPLVADQGPDGGDRVRHVARDPAVGQARRGEDVVVDVDPDGAQPPRPQRRRGRGGHPVELRAREGRVAVALDDDPVAAATLSHRGGDALAGAEDGEGVVRRHELGGRGRHQGGRGVLRPHAATRGRIDHGAGEGGPEAGGRDPVLHRPLDPQVRGGVLVPGSGEGRPSRRRGGGDGLRRGCRHGRRRGQHHRRARGQGEDDRAGAAGGEAHVVSLGTGRSGHRWPLRHGGQEANPPPPSLSGGRARRRRVGPPAVGPSSVVSPRGRAGSDAGRSGLRSAWSR